MTTSSDEKRSWSRDDDAKRPRSRNRQYMIAPLERGLSEQGLIERLNRMPGIEIVRSHSARGRVCPPIAVVLASDDNAAALRRSMGRTFLLEADSLLRPAALADSWLPRRADSVTSALGPGVTTAVQVLSEAGQPVENAEVQLVGEQWATQGLTDKDGRISLSLYGELPETITEILVKPRTNYWGFSRTRPDLQTGAINTIVLRRLSPDDQFGWGGKAMRFDLLPAECRAAGIKLALIDSGVETSQPQLARIANGIGLRRGDASPWLHDAMGHGTPCAGVISATANGANGIRGLACDAELHVCKLPLDARCSDLVEAFDYCLQNGVDVACLGFGCRQGSAIVEQRIMGAKQNGIAVIAAAGNTAGPVQFPAWLPHVMAVGAIGLVGSYLHDSPQAALAAAAESLSDGLFAPAFSCRGPELDVVAPGVAVISCQAPEGYAACDGTSLAASHVAALAAVILAHHGDFHRDFAVRDSQRVERLFQVLKDTAQPIGQVWQTGAGLPDAARALGLPSQPWPAGQYLDGALDDMRRAVRHIDVAANSGADSIAAFEPPRGPATVTRLPLNPLPLTAMAGGETFASIHALRAAMNFAGLAANRYH